MKAEQARTVTGYLTRLGRARKRGDATELTYRAFLQELIEALAKGVTCTNVLFLQGRSQRHAPPQP